MKRANEVDVHDPVINRRNLQIICFTETAMVRATSYMFRLHSEPDNVVILVTVGK